LNHRPPPAAALHLADGAIPANGGAVSSDLHDAFAIRYRVF
jgi:hypothetical protein